MTKFIDADFINYEQIESWGNDGNTMRCDFEKVAYKNEIDAIHAADVRPVVKAHWTDHRTNEHDGEWYCSACGKAITIYMGPDRDDRYSYCPNCGADMREVTINGN